MNHHNPKDLKVWQKAIDFTTLLYAKTKNFPNDERFGLISQMRRAAVSIPSNVSEGAGQGGKKEFAHFLSIAQGSAFELETQIIVSKNLDYLNQESKDELLKNLSEIQRMVYALRKRLLEK